MSRIRRCIIKTCEFYSGTHDKTIRMFRIPKEINLKEKWLENIKGANNETYSGNGFVCIQHFKEEQLKIKNNKCELLKAAVPTEFFVEPIEHEDSDDHDDGDADNVECRFF